MRKIALIAHPSILLATGKCSGPGLAYWPLAEESWGAFLCAVPAAG